MPTLYVRSGCPYSRTVLLEAEELDVTLDLKDVDDPQVAAELVERGGKLQLPYLVDEVHGVEMYESDDIIAHLHASFTPKP
jgi:glutathione S-transferase